MMARVRVPELRGKFEGTPMNGHYNYFFSKSLHPPHPKAGAVEFSGGYFNT